MCIKRERTFSLCCKKITNDVNLNYSENINKKSSIKNFNEPVKKKSLLEQIKRQLYLAKKLETCFKDYEL